MKLFNCTLLFICICLFACNSKKNMANTDVEVADVFIKSLNQNKFDDVEKYLLNDKTNKEYFELTKKSMLNRPTNELDAYKNADLIIHETKSISDSVTVINYSNSNKKEQSNNLKLVKVNGQWLVDLKFTFLDK